MATAAELAGTDATPDNDGVSILPALLGGIINHPPLYWEFHIKNCKGYTFAVRMGK